MSGAARRVAAVALLVLLLLVPGGDVRPSTAAPTGPGGQEAAGDGGHERMRTALAALGDASQRSLVEAKIATLRTELEGLEPEQASDRARISVMLGEAEMQAGAVDDAVARFEEVLSLVSRVPAPRRDSVALTGLLLLATGRLRQGIVANCADDADACFLAGPEGGFDARVAEVRDGIQRLVGLALQSPPGHPINLTTRWLASIAVSLLGEGLDRLPEAARVEAPIFRGGGEFPSFRNVGPAVGLDAVGYAGGAAVEDFDGDGLLDVATSSMDVAGPVRLFRNAGDGTFVERTGEANLDGITGGLNLEQADYDDDGDVDLLVLRGAWRGRDGRWPNSLLRNDGSGRFTDVTFAAGLGDVHYPTQTGAWADYDLDGDLDLFVGNEALGDDDFPSQLFRNEGNGRFVDVAATAGVENRRWAKGATWGDHDEDGDPDLYVSNRLGANRLYRNDGDGTFTDVAPELGVTGPHASFATWFWDVDQDGHLDLLVNGYHGEQRPSSLPVWQVAASRLGLEHDAELPHLYLGDGDGGFREAAAEWGLDRVTLPMGSNFGDLDNDGWLDFYLGTGYPGLEGLIPNVMYRNDAGARFVEVTGSGFGNLLKGHGVAFADVDNDGDQDVFEQMGGFYASGRAPDVLFENPGFGHHWITLELRGTRANRLGVGARIRLVVETDAGRRELYRHVGTGGSFGADPFREEIGLGSADRVELLEVLWPGDSKPRVFRDVAADRFYRVGQDADALEELDRPRVRLGGGEAGNGGGDQRRR